MNRRTVNSPSSCLIALLSVLTWNGTAKPLMGRMIVNRRVSTIIYACIVKNEIARQKWETDLLTRDGIRQLIFPTVTLKSSPLFLPRSVRSSTILGILFHSILLSLRRQFLLMSLSTIDRFSIDLSSFST